MFGDLAATAVGGANRGAIKPLKRQPCISRARLGRCGLVARIALRGRLRGRRRRGGFSLNGLCTRLGLSSGRAATTRLRWASACHSPLHFSSLEEYSLVSATKHVRSDEQVIAVNIMIGAAIATPPVE